MVICLIFPDNPLSNEQELSGIEQPRVSRTLPKSASSALKLEINIMKNFLSFRKALRLTAVMAVAFTVCGEYTLTAADDTAKADAKTTRPTAEKKLTGAELYAVNCNRCHQERYPTEFTSAQWSTLMTHMRVRAQLPAKQAKLILKYMKEEAGN